MRTLNILALTLFLKTFSLAQNFDYVFKQTRATYNEIEAPVFLANGASWLSADQSIPIGFSFVYLGSNFQSVTITNDGVIKFGNDFKFYCFGARLENQIDSTGTSLSSISYITEGDTGSKVLKIQFKNCKFLNNSAGYINFQIRLYESSNKISMIIGEKQFNEALLNEAHLKVGLWNSSAQSGFLLSGNADHPAAISTGHSSVNLSGYPNMLSVYEFIPN
jgi:hypothetical protein